MASVVEDLKCRWDELNARLEAIRAEALALEAQKAAFETVIAVYDPEFAAAPLKARRGKGDRSTPARQVTDLLKGRDVRRGVLEALRGAPAPITASEVSQAFIRQEGIEEAATSLGQRIVSRVAGVLDKLGRDGLVRATEAGDGRRRLWEIAR
jgi:hypothetical protein